MYYLGHILTKKYILLAIFVVAISMQIADAKQCDLGQYFLPQKGDCDSCYQGCATCNSNLQEDCLSCQDTFITIQFNNQQLCSKCQYSEYYNKSSSQCQSCNFDCEMCYDSITCLKCRKGYLYDPSTKSCSTSLCDFGFYRDSTRNQCIQCPVSLFSTSCTYYSYPGYSYFQVNSCIKGMILYSNECICSRGSYMDMQINPPTCMKCDDINCEVCESKNSCSYCKSGFYYDNISCVIKSDSDYNFYYQANSNVQEFRTFPYSQSPNPIIQIVKYQYDGSKYCTQFLSYHEGIGCFNVCPPHYFSLFSSVTNSFNCVKRCPKNYTLNLNRLSCISNDSSNDISQIFNGSTHYRTCPLGQFFPPYISEAVPSSCQNNYSTCLSQNDHDYYCTECKIGYIGSSCSLGCSSTTYMSSDYCYSCGNRSCQDYCKYLIVGFLVGCTESCPKGYSTNTTTNICEKCVISNQLVCDGIQPSLFQCEWGQDSTKQTCDQFLMLSQNNYLNQKGFVLQSSDSCKIYETNSSLCKQCGPTSMFNLKGVCTEGFYRATKYYVLPDPNEFDPLQYLVVEQCPVGYFVQLRYINNFNYRVCKKFAVCDYDEAEKLCIKCHDDFYLLNGNCIDDCPVYTYKNKTTRVCEYPIEKCASYDNDKCRNCLIEFITNFDNTKCILPSECNVTNGYFIDRSQLQCKQCIANCLVCDSVLTCQLPTQGYFLQENIPVINCQTGFYGDQNTQNCLKCMDLCIKCNDEKTCTQPYLNEQVKFLNNRTFINDSILCSSGAFYDQISSTCINCSSSCKECLNCSNQCLKCSDSTLVIDQFSCITVCPSGKYSAAHTIFYSNIIQKICDQCDAICLECEDTAQSCTKCGTGYFLFQKTYLLTCPNTHYAQDNTCYVKCPDGKFNTAPEVCSPCGLGCSKCIDESTCLVCTIPQYLQGQVCQEKCNDLFKENPSQPNVCLPCEIYNCSYCIVDSKIQCELCQDQYVLKNQRYCMKKSVESNESEDEKQMNSINQQIEKAEQIINYSGKIYEGQQCHFTCNKCKGDKVDECLNCKLVNRVFYNNKYCMCPDGTYENGEKKCLKVSNNYQIISILDICTNWIVLISTLTAKISILSFLLIDLLSLGSQQLYLEQLYNYMDKQTLLQILDQSNFSYQIPNILKVKQMKNIGIFLEKTMLVVEGDEEIEESLRFANLSSKYLINAFPYFAQFLIGLVISFPIGRLKPLVFQEAYPTFLICFYYFTFQDQILFLGLQLKYIQFNSSLLNVLSLTFMCLSLSFNVFILFKLYRHYELLRYKQTKSPFQLLISFPTIFVGLLLKVLNAMNIIVTPPDLKSYIFVTIIGIKVIFEIFNLFYTSNHFSQSVLYKLIRSLIIIQAVTFLLPSVLNSGYRTNKILDDKVLHNLQGSIAFGIVIEKIILCFIECLFFLINNNKYLSLLRKDTTTSLTNQENSTLNCDFRQFNIQDLEDILTKKPLQFKKRSS